MCTTHGVSPKLHKTERIWNGFMQHWQWLVVILVILTAAMVRLHLLDVPLERDEGEHAYAGQLILQGVSPFQEDRLPGVYIAYALIMAVFGETPSGIHLGLLFVNIGTVILLVFIGKNVVLNKQSVKVCHQCPNNVANTGS